MYKLLVVALVFVYIASAAPPPAQTEPKKDFKKGWEPQPAPEPEPNPWNQHPHNKQHVHGEPPKKGGPPFHGNPPPFGQHPYGPPKQGPGHFGPVSAPTGPKSGIGGPGKPNVEGGQKVPQGNPGVEAKPDVVPVESGDGGANKAGGDSESVNPPIDTPLGTPVEQPVNVGETGSVPVDGVPPVESVEGVVGENSGSPSESDGAGQLDLRTKKQ